MVEEDLENRVIERLSDSEDEKQVSRKINYFEKFLPIWVVLCILLGIILSQFVPEISETINSLQIGGISIPIGICLFLMMYPAMLNLQASELKKLGKNPKPIILTLVSNWLIAPFVGLAMVNIFLPGNAPEIEQLKVAIILLSSSPCTAMVLVWGWMAKGKHEFKHHNYYISICRYGLITHRYSKYPNQFMVITDFSRFLYRYSVIARNHKQKAFNIIKRIIVV